VKFAFIEDALAAEFPVGVACDVLGVSRSGYYARRDRPASARAARNAALTVKLEAAHAEHRGVYGSPRLHAALAAAGERVSENTVAKLMRQRGIRAKARRKFVPRTTDSSHARPVADNVLGRDFAPAAPAPDRAWAADITYVPTDQGWLYLAGVIDLCSRRIVGWAMADHRETGLVSDALKMALVRRRPEAGLLHHSDRGCQYASDDYQHLLARHGITCSMSGKGDCWDNAPIESFWATLKTELVNHARYATRAQATASIFEYVEVFYNRKRLHSALGYVSPEQFEAGLN
jgi:transposase InsO family protein